jgi:hypothetical protein
VAVGELEANRRGSGVRAAARGRQHSLGTAREPKDGKLAPSDRRLMDLQGFARKFCFMKSASARVALYWRSATILRNMADTAPSNALAEKLRDLATEYERLAERLWDWQEDQSACHRHP